MKNMERGSALGDAMVLIMLCIVIFIFIVPAERGMPKRDTFTILGDYIGSPEQGTFSMRNSGPNAEWTQNLRKDSPQAGSVSVNMGDGSYAAEPEAEYVTIENRGDATSITGWTLKNAKDKRVYTLGGTIQHYPADVATIPAGTMFISPGGKGPMQNIILEHGDQAIVTTGRPPSNTKYQITSFKENECSGYLGRQGDMTFRPELAQNCPLPNTEPGVSSLDKDCRNYISSLGQCRTPQYDQVVNGDVCRDCADRIQLTSQCIAFLKAHYSYESCLANHSGDSNFYLHTWRIYLGRGWEMWNTDQEIISLFDGSGRLVDYKSY